MKFLVSIIALAIVVAFTAPTLATETVPQPLTRADCDKAGMKWDDQANVCSGETVDGQEKKGHDKKKHGHGHDKKKHGHGHDKKKHGHGHDKKKHGHGKKPHDQGKFKWPWQWQKKMRLEPA